MDRTPTTPPTTRTRTLLLAAASVAALVAASPARADHDGDRWGGTERHERWEGPAPWNHPAPAVAPVPAYPPPAYRVAPAYPRARWHASREASRLRAESRALDAARDWFFATWDGNPWRRARFESWYASRRAELDREWSALDRWRG